MNIDWKTRRETFISPEVGEILVKQIQHEFENQRLYQNFQYWFDNNGYVGQAEYFKKRAHEEKNHAQWIIEWLTQADYLFEVPEVKQMEISIHSEESIKLEIIQPHIQTVDKEIETTELIKNIYDISIQNRDYLTSLWLSKLLLEQAEEESLSHLAIDAFDKSSDPILIDMYFAKHINKKF